MPADSIAHCRRTQGNFARALGGQQPWADHARRQRFGSPPVLLNLRNTSALFAAALLLTPAVRAQPVHAGTAPTGAALLPSAQASSGHDYHAVTTAAELGNAAAVGCIARPRDCSSLLLGAAVGSVVSGVVGGWIGWRAGLDHAVTPECLPGGAGLLQASTSPSAPLVSPTVPGFSPADLDPEQNPCESLYAHVNQRWANRTSLPDGNTLWDVPAMLQERSLQTQLQIAAQAALADAPGHAQRVVGDLWRSGMDARQVQREGLRPLRAELAAIDALGSPAAIAAHLCELTAKGRNPLFSFSVDVDMDDRSQLIAYAFQGGLGLPDCSDYQRDDRQTERHAYLAHIARVLRLSGIAADEAEQQAQAIFDLERRLAEASLPWAELTSDLTTFYRPVSVADADILTPNFSWTALFDTLGIAPPATFSLASLPFHRAVSAALVDTEASTWRAYLRFHVLDDASPYLSDAFAQAHHDFHVSVLKGPQPLPTREDRVLTAIERFAGTAMAELYVAEAFPAQTRQRIEQMVGQLRDALKQRLQRLPWMDAGTRQLALERADALQPRIGHPEQWPDWSRLHTESCGYLRNLRRAQMFNQRAEIARIGTPVDPSRWRMTAQSVDAYYDVMSNDMAFAAGLLQPPYFDANADDALNYGAIGVAIGHEMAHAFSAEASQFGPDGRLQRWWSPQDLVRYNALVNRISAQVSALGVDGQAVDGRLTSGENLADLGGLAIALDALQAATADQPDPMLDGLSREQRFFISWAVLCRRLHTPAQLQQDLETNPHAPGQVRADLAPSNLPAFAQAFHCPPGAAMARRDSQRVLFL
ncbi:M13 family metallopeptidase [Stenotrophomonas sp. PS02289]|uniref:M13 family metallopeptidase n=1 Tax=Stenotrophomonas sp. PS02289 TaxID=2991422 RepID=UPI00249B2CFF|nr:M13 family metallopeptidase [Stenotrophomonas sp. PS02289]